MQIFISTKAANILKKTFPKYLYNPIENYTSNTIFTFANNVQMLISRKTEYQWQISFCQKFVHAQWGEDARKTIFTFSINITINAI